MKNNNSSNKSTGLGVDMVLLIVFIVLKLVGVINWSWWWVLSPLWISFGIGLLIVIVAVIKAILEDL